MRLIQPLKFRILKTGCFKMPRLQTPRLQMGVFQMVITVASGLCPEATVNPIPDKTLKNTYEKIGV